ncbi:MAG: V-type ATP synthase subunit F [Candidatus Hydrothermarchaeota archaeon]
MEIAVIGDTDTVTGFRLAGIKETYDGQKPEEIEKTLRNLMKREDICIIIITERVAESVRSVIDELEDKKISPIPIIVEIPDKKGPIEREISPIRELIRKAVGVDITG